MEFENLRFVTQQRKATQQRDDQSHFYNFAGKKRQRATLKCRGPAEVHAEREPRASPEENNCLAAKQSAHQRRASRLRFESARQRDGCAALDQPSGGEGGRKADPPQKRS